MNQQQIKKVIDTLTNVKRSLEVTSARADTSSSSQEVLLWQAKLLDDLITLLKFTAL